MATSEKTQEKMNQYYDTMRKINKNMRMPLDLPKANLVRIQVLTPAEREKYLGSIDAAIDKNVKSPIYNTIYDGDPIFYGVMQGDNDLSFGITPDWQKSGAGGSLGGMIRDFASQTELGKTVGAAGDIMKAMTGINGSATGSATMQSFEGVGLEGFTVDCAWYLPEQWNLCILSLRNISRMAYPVQVPDEQLAAAIGNGVNATQNAIAGVTATDAQQKAIDNEKDEGKKAEMQGNLREQGKNKDMGSAIMGKAVGAAGAGLVASTSALTYVNDLLGRNLTLDPIPVRCSIGHYVEIEPLVISGIKYSFSKDTFIHEKTGRHLPVTCSISITFKFWMTPAPKLEFMQLIGREMFGEGIDNKVARDAAAAIDAMNAEAAAIPSSKIVPETQTQALQRLSGGKPLKPMTMDQLFKQK